MNLRSSARGLTTEASPSAGPRRPRRPLRQALLAVPLGLVACSSFGAVYPPRPPASPGAPVADPTPSRIVTHVTVTGDGLRAALEGAVPQTGDGTFSLLGSERRYTWTRDPLVVSFAAGRVVLDAHVSSTIAMPVGALDIPIDVHVIAEPVVSSLYVVKLQSTEVRVTSTDKRMKVADHVAGVFDTIGAGLDAKIRDFRYDLRPSVAEAYARISKPIDLPMGAAHGCAWLKVLGVEAGPTVVADGLEKDLALVVAPEVTLPCAAPAEPPPLPAFANVPLVPAGPFTVTVPIAARYDELERAMGRLFTNGKYFFSSEYPKLYLERPELYEAQGEIVLKVHIRGPVHKMGIDADLDGDLFLSGHLAVVDNEVQIPDLEPTIETKNFFLSLKAMTDGGRIRDQARAALRLDLSERLKAVREKVSKELTFETDAGGAGKACFQGDLDKIEVVSAHAHGSYLRVYVAVTARTRATLPCNTASAPSAVDGGSLNRGPS